MADSGPRFGRYRLQGRIAAGGMGEVFKATAQAFDGVQKRVAIKLIRTGLEGDPDLVKMFVEEAKVAFLLTHANLVQTFDVGTIDGQYFLAMEYVEGMTLAQVLRGCRDVLGQPMPQRHAVSIAVETLKGLHYAHRFRDGSGKALGIVHRDVSPSNILISLEGEVKVSDFGIAWSTMKTHRSQLGTIKGKVPYMPPEQVRGARLDARADVYAVGAVLYECLCGRPPFLGPPGAIIPLVVEGRFPRPRELDPAIPAELEAIALHALAPAADARYESAAAMRDELEDLAMRQAWRLSSLDLASFVRALDVPAPSPEAGGAGAFDLALGEELRKVGEGQALSVFTSVALRPSAESFGGGPPGTHGDREPSGEEAGPPTRETTPDRPMASAGDRLDSTPPSVTGTGDTAGERPRRRTALYALYAAALVLVALVGALAARSDGRSGDPGPPPVPPSPIGDLPGSSPVGDFAASSPVGDFAASSPVGDFAASQAAPRAPASPVVDPAVSSPVGDFPGSPAGLPLGAAPPGVAPAVPTVVGQGGGTSATLAINTEPWTYVDVDGARIGPTPQRQRVRPGRHVLRLTNPARGISRTLVVVLREGEVRRIVLELSADHEPGR
ncbi:MAG: protein kinase [Deltaproteobacteria bacterium]|nr:protein kinase [Deltaproteobacteria bacterium]